MPGRANGDAQALDVLIPNQVLEMEAQEKQEIEELKRLREPPIVFRDVVDACPEFDKLRQSLEGKLNDSEMQSIEELQQYVVDNEGSWALGDNFLNFVGQSPFLERLFS